MLLNSRDWDCLAPMHSQHRHIIISEKVNEASKVALHLLTDILGAVLLQIHSFAFRVSQPFRIGIFLDQLVYFVGFVGHYLYFLFLVGHFLFFAFKGVGGGFLHAISIVDFPT